MNTLMTLPVAPLALGGGVALCMCSGSADAGSRPTNPAPVARDGVSP